MVDTVRCFSLCRITHASDHSFPEALSSQRNLLRIFRFPDFAIPNDIPGVLILAPNGLNSHCFGVRNG